MGNSPAPDRQGVGIRGSGEMGRKTTKTTNNQQPTTNNQQPTIN
ncbi:MULTISPECIES: hypothetical protein [Fischerella]|nr:MULTISPECIES: hypothetical protein [Fischerella]